MKLTPVEVEIAKSVFQAHGVDLGASEEVNKTRKWAAFLRILPITCRV